MMLEVGVWVDLEDAEELPAVNQRFNAYGRTIAKALDASVKGQRLCERRGYISFTLPPETGSADIKRTLDNMKTSQAIESYDLEK